MPYYIFKLVVPVNHKEVLERIATIISHKNFSKIEKLSPITSWTANLPMVPIQKKPFLGTINQEDFIAKRIVNYKNAFLPYIKGEIIEVEKTSHISIQMILHLPALILICAWTIIGILFCLIYYLFNANLGNALEAIFPVLIFGGGLILMSLGFFPEVIIAKRLLSQAILLEESGLNK